jgi:hypothetical protein
MPQIPSPPGSEIVGLEHKSNHNSEMMTRQIQWEVQRGIETRILGWEVRKRTERAEMGLKTLVKSYIGLHLEIERNKTNALMLVLLLPELLLLQLLLLLLLLMLLMLVAAAAVAVVCSPEQVLVLARCALPVSPHRRRRRPSLVWHAYPSSFSSFCPSAAPSSNPSARVYPLLPAAAPSPDLHRQLQCRQV